MPIFDQYEVEVASAYSGSYADDVMFGNMFVNAATLVSGYTPLGQPGPKTSRRLVGSRVNGKSTTYPNINKMWIPNYAIDGYASGSWLGRPQKFVTGFSNEYWYDSYVPNPINIYQKNGGKLYSGTYNDVVQLLGSGIVNEYSGSSFEINPLVDTTASYSPNIGMSLLFVDKGYPSFYPDADNVWVYNFPYQSTYKNINRILTVGAKLPRYYSVDTTIFGSPMTPASQSNEIASVWRIKQGFFESTYGYMNHPTQQYQYGTLAGPVIPPGIGTISNIDLNKNIFGIGRGSSVYDELLSIAGVPYSVLNSGPNYQGYWGVVPLFGVYISLFSTVLIRGYKYGIRSVQPEQQKVIYRLGRYGQLRDTLEGRITTTSLIEGGINPYNNLPINKTLFYPIQVAFLSGTNIYNQSKDYVTATNPSYNPYDSGIYDIYYRSGQPFFDRDNED